MAKLPCPCAYRDEPQDHARPAVCKRLVASGRRMALTASVWTPVPSSVDRSLRQFARIFALLKRVTEIAYFVLNAYLGGVVSANRERLQVPEEQFFRRR